jgi:hypothetical protein
MPRSVKDACFQASQMPAAYAKITEVYLKRCAGAVEECRGPLEGDLSLPRARKTRRTALSR